MILLLVPGPFLGRQEILSTLLMNKAISQKTQQVGKIAIFTQEVL